MRKHLLILSAATLGLAGSALVAQAPGPMAGKTMTRAEAQTHAAERFARMDANKDGKLDQADRTARQAERFKAIDSDGNGSISQSEFSAAHQRKGGGHDGMKHHGAGHGKAGGKRAMGGMMMARMADTDKDGAISRDEFLSAHLKHFDAADANKDGSVSADEHKAARQKMHEHMKRMRDDRPAPPPKPQ